MDKVNNNASKCINEFIEFTEEEKKLIKEYCDTRIELIKKGPKIPGWFEVLMLKCKIKRVIEKFNHIKPAVFDELYNMVWNFEYLDKNHNALNLSILAKLEDTNHYKDICKEYEKYLKRRKEKENNERDKV